MSRYLQKSYKKNSLNENMAKSIIFIGGAIALYFLVSGVIKGNAINDKYKNAVDIPSSSRKASHNGKPAKISEIKVDNVESTELEYITQITYDGKSAEKDPRNATTHSFVIVDYESNGLLIYEDSSRDYTFIRTRKGDTLDGVVLQQSEQRSFDKMDRDERTQLQSIYDSIVGR